MNPPFNRSVSTDIGKKFFSLLGKHFPKAHQLHKLFNHNNVKVSYISLPNFKSVINGHNKDILNKEEKPSPCNCRDILPVKRKLPTLKNVHLKIGCTNITIRLSTSQRQIQQNFLISYGVKRKRRLMWILIGAF